MGGRHEISLALPGKLTRRLRGLLLCVSPRFFEPFFRLALSSASTPFCFDPFRVSTPFWADLFLHRLSLASTPFVCVCVKEISKTAAGGRRLLRLATIDFVTPKVSTSISKTDSVFGAGFAQWSVVFVFKNRVEPKIGATPVKVFREFDRKMASFGQNIIFWPKLAIFLPNSRNTSTGGSANFRLNPILKRENDRPLSNTGGENGICFFLELVTFGVTKSIVFRF